MWRLRAASALDAHKGTALAIYYSYLLAIYKLFSGTFWGFPTSWEVLGSFLEALDFSRTSFVDPGICSGTRFPAWALFWELIFDPGSSIFDFFNN